MADTVSTLPYSADDPWPSVEGNSTIQDIITDLISYAFSWRSWVGYSILTCGWLSLPDLMCYQTQKSRVLTCDWFFLVLWGFSLMTKNYPSNLAVLHYHVCFSYGTCHGITYGTMVSPRGALGWLHFSFDHWNIWIRNPANCKTTPYLIPEYSSQIFRCGLECVILTKQLFRFMEKPIYVE